MKRSTIVTGVALALVLGAATSSLALTYTFPPDIPVKGDTESVTQTKWDLQKS